MKYYRNTNTNEVFAYEDDGSQDFLIGTKVLMTLEELDLHRNPPKTQEQLELEITNTIQGMLDTKAQSYEFDNMKSARAQSAVPLTGAEEAEELAIMQVAITLAQWELKCWGTSSRIRNDVISGNRSMPAVNDVLAEMPICSL